MNRNRRLHPLGYGLHRRSPAIDNITASKNIFNRGLKMLIHLDPAIVIQFQIPQRFFRLINNPLADGFDVEILF